MKTVTYYCDKCKKKIDRRVDYIGAEVGVTEANEYDLCKDCAEELEALISGFFDDAEEVQG